MIRNLTILRAWGAALLLLVIVPAHAASLQPVSNWGATGVPSTVSMYIYVPDRLATNPPVLVCAHYCGGSAAAVFGQAQGGGLIKAADQYGFLMIFPQATNKDGSGRCWDVGTTKSLTHDGGGDTQAIAQMVNYAIGKYDANRERVYASGTSSGAMMTEALLATYPNVFKAGVEFAGVPAGCWAVGASADGTWSNQCAGGQVTRTAQEWGNLARKMYAGYSGHRPRIQLWHGDADKTISYQNHVEAIKQWTNVLGLSTEPTSTATLTYGTHQWTRQSWKSSCGFTVLDAWTEQKGEHGVPDVNLNAQYTVPFLGLDKAGATDPETAQCGDGGNGGNADAGGTDSARDGGSHGSRDAGSIGGQDGGHPDGSDGSDDEESIDAGRTVDAGRSVDAGGHRDTKGQSGSDAPVSGGLGGCGSVLGAPASGQPLDAGVIAIGLAALFLARRKNWG